MLNRRQFLQLLPIFAAGSVYAASKHTSARAATNFKIDRNEVRQRYPIKITFNIDITSAEDVSEITLVYGTNGQSCLNAEVKNDIDFEAGSALKVAWDWDLKNTGSIPPGAKLWWRWEITDRAGNTTVTEKRTVAIDDGRFTWKRVEKDGVAIHWVEGSGAFGNSLLDLALKGVANIDKRMGVRPNGAIALWVYPTTDDMKDALHFSPEWTGGVAIPDYNSIMTAIQPGQTSWARDVVPHEVTHLVIGGRMFNCAGGGLPTWLNEGLAVINEDINTRDVSGVVRALEKRAILSLRSLQGEFANDPDLARTHYDFSGEVTEYLVSTGGPKKLSQLLDLMREANTIDDALKQVYGFDTDGLDAAWRKKAGVKAPVQVAPTATPKPATKTKSKKTPVPTLALLNPNVTATPKP